MISNTIHIKHAILDNKRIAYSNRTTFLIQIGKNIKSSYKTKYTIVGNLHQALMYYKGINLGNGYKKRLYSPDMNKPILAREWS